MPRIQILDERKYPMPNLKQDDGLPYWRWEHRATLGRAGRTFIAFVDNGIYKNEMWLKMPKAFIEEISTGNMTTIDNDELFKEIHGFAENLGLLQIQYPLAKE